MDGLTDEETAIVMLDPGDQEVPPAARELGHANASPGKLVEQLTGLGIAVTTTPAAIRDIYWIHAVLAGELAARAWDARDDQLLVTISQHHETYLKDLEAGPSGREAELFGENWAFHSAIYRQADSPAIAVTVKKTIRYFPEVSLDIPGWYEVGAVWQEQLIRQFKKGTREGARKAVVYGSSKSAELYIAALWPGRVPRRTSRRGRPGAAPARSWADAIPTCGRPAESL
jgi:hypothetical protein